MGFFTAIKTCFRKYATFNGRALRSEFWFFVLFWVLADLVLGTLDDILAFEQYQALSNIFFLLTIFPGVAVRCRRLHDINFSGWWQAPVAVSQAVLTVALYYAVIYSGVDLEDTDALLQALQNPVIAISFIAAVISSIGLLVACCIKGSPDGNKYGVPPELIAK